MKNIGILAFAFFIIFAFAGRDLRAQEVTFKWFGQGCFLIETSQGTQIITDPMKMGAYMIPEDIEPDIVTVSHEHFDHNQVDAVSGKPSVLRGLTSGGKDFAAVDKKIKDVRVTSVSSFHDDSQGSERGKNAIFVFEFDGLKAVHLGDLGHELNAEQVDKIGAVDIVMIPVGGTYTIFGETADKVISQLDPKMIVFPMHFQTEAASFLPYTGEDFVENKQNVKKVDGNAFTLDVNSPPSGPTYILLTYK